jgi:DNA helicase HerA-like ATPase
MTDKEALKESVVTLKELVELEDRLAMCGDDEILLADDFDLSLSTPGYYLSDEERSTHMHIMGSTGGGKSKLIEFMLRQDINRGVGICLIDPHGELYYDILRYIIKNCDDDIKQKVFLINPTSKEYFVSFNPLQMHRGDAGTHAKRILSSLEKVWKTDFNEKPGIKKALKNVFKTAIIRNFTMHEVAKLLYDENTRNDFARELEYNPLKEPELQNYWIDVVKNSKQHKPILDGAYTRLEDLIDTKALKMMTLKEKSIDFNDVVNKDGIILVNLAESNSFDQKSALTLGVLVVNELLSVFKERSETFIFAGDNDKKIKWNPYYLYVDEFHEFFTPDFSKILSGTRKFGLHIILANQTFSQLDKLDESLRRDIMNNATVKAYFPLKDMKDSEEVIYQLGKYEPKVKEKVTRLQQFADGFDSVETTARSYSTGSTSMNFNTGERLVARHRIDQSEENIYFTTQEVSLMEGKQFQLLKKRVFLFHSGQQQKGLYLATDWVFQTECKADEIYDFERFVGKNHSDIYEKISVLEKRLAELEGSQSLSHQNEDYTIDYDDSKGSLFSK